MPVLTLEQALQCAVERHRAGALAEAEAIYREVLAQLPDHPDALNLLSDIKCRTGDLAAALALIDRAVALHPGVPLFHVTRGSVLKAWQRADEATASFHRALALDPKSAAAHCNLGHLWREAGQWEKAIPAYRSAVALDPASSPALQGFGLALIDAGRMAEAIDCFHASLRLDPGCADAWHNLGVAFSRSGNEAEAVAALRSALRLQPGLIPPHRLLPGLLGRLGRAEEAIEAYRAAVYAIPDEAGAWNDFCVALADYQVGPVGEPRNPAKDARLDEAIAAGRRAVALQPNLAVAHYNLGNALARRELMDEAIASFRCALALDPNHAGAACNLGFVLLGFERLGEAIDYCERAVDLKPESKEAGEHLCVGLLRHGEYEQALRQFRRLLGVYPDFMAVRRALGITLLMLGQYEEGWREYEARVTFFSPPPHPAPRWSGAPIPGGAIFLQYEQGFGDSLQFIRYAPLVRARAGASRVILECQPELARLLTQNGGWQAEITPRAADPASVPPYHAYLPLLSLPLVLGLPEPLIMTAPYLRADPALRAAWRERLAPAAGLRVGLAWAGNSSHDRDRARSIPAEMFRPLLNSPGASFYSLQLGPAALSARSLIEAGLIDLTAHLGDFADTAAFMAELDLIISVDTAVVHLAGAMGWPVWTLLPFVPDWRWGLACEETPWYPSMRLFRQPALGDWASVIDRVAAELRAMAPGGSV